MLIFYRNYVAFNWVVGYLHRVKDQISTKFEVYEVTEYLGEKYKEAAQIVAYEDAWNIVEALANGDFIGEDHKALLRLEKIDLMMDILEHPVNRTREEVVDVMRNMKKQATTCPVICTIF